MKTRTLILGLVLAAGATGCVDAHTGTETGNPPVLTEALLSVQAAGADSVEVSGEPGAVAPGGGQVTVRNASSGEEVTVDVSEDGSFSATLPGTLDDDYEVIASNDNGTSDPGDLHPNGVPIDPTDPGDPGEWMKLHACDPGDPRDPLTITDLDIDGDTMNIGVSHSGGCAMHSYGLCFSESWAESFPIQLGFEVLHDAMGDACEAEESAQLSFDLTPFKDAYRDAYQTEDGAASISFSGCISDGMVGGCSVLYEWGATGPTMIEVHNISDYDYDNLVVGEESYGTLRSGERTEYRDFGVAYDYNYVSLEIDGMPFLLQPIDFLGETPLGPGNFTYEVGVLDATGSTVTIQVAP